MKKMALSIVAFSLLSGSVFAGNDLFEIGGLVNIERTDSSSPVKNTLKDIGVRGNWRLAPQFLLGLEYDRALNPKSKACECLGNGEPIYNDIDINRYYLNAFYEFFDRDENTPYALLGLGYQDVDTDLNYDTGTPLKTIKSGMIGHIGLGYKAKLAEKLEGFIEGKIEQDFKNDFTDYALGAGLMVPIGTYGAVATAPVKKKAVAAVRDSDHDGVIDTKDRCPGTPAGVAVDMKGCPLDDDSDGVPNYLDQCPGTPENVEAVNEKGCPVPVASEKVEQTQEILDSDGDGVEDSKDLCPDTPVGIVVNKDGCPLVINLHINFDFDSARVKKKYYPKIREVVQLLKEHPEYTAEIQGHTDGIGSAEYNKKLSLRRAKAVYDIMVKMGIDPSRLTYEGYGEEMPIADNCTPEGRAKNRRVEVHFYQ